MRFEEFTSTIQKTILELQKEIWGSVVTTTCPHPACKKKSPGIKRDGHTKLFVKPLASQHLRYEKQRERLSSAQTGTGALSDMDHQTARSNTNASTAAGRGATTSLDIREGEEQTNAESQQQ